MLPDLPAGPGARVAWWYNEKHEELHALKGVMKKALDQLR